MSDVLRCGDGGGTTADGSPCQRRVAEEGDRCPQHPREGEPAPAGRPKITFDDEELKRIEQLAGFGLTQDEIAQVMGTSHDTITRRKKDSDKFLRAFRRGRSQAQARAAGRYHQIAFGRDAGLGLPEGESVAVSEQRKALEKILRSDYWKDTTQLEHSGGMEVEVDDVRERLARRLASATDAGEEAEPPARLQRNGGRGS